MYIHTLKESFGDKGLFKVIGYLFIFKKIKGTNSANK